MSRILLKLFFFRCLQITWRSVCLKCYALINPMIFVFVHSLSRTSKRVLHKYLCFFLYLKRIQSSFCGLLSRQIYLIARIYRISHKVVCWIFFTKFIFIQSPLIWIFLWKRRGKKHENESKMELKVQSTKADKASPAAGIFSSNNDVITIKRFYLVKLNDKW